MAILLYIAYGVVFSLALLTLPLLCLVCSVRAIYAQRYCLHKSVVQARGFSLKLSKEGKDGSVCVCHN